MITLNDLSKVKGNIWVDEIYLPYLGKCTVYNDFDEATKGFVAVSAKVLNKNRVDENGTHYEIIGDANYTESIDINIDYDNKTVSGHYYKKWIGGLTEKYNFKFIIKEDSLKTTKDDLSPETIHLTLNCELGE